MYSNRVDHQLCLKTTRLYLRPFCPGDAEMLVQIANDFKVADTTLAVPHPFNHQSAVEWLRPLPLYFEAGMRTTWAITGILDGLLMGMISLSTDATSEGAAELGFWLGSAYWNQGLATEAGVAVLDYAINHRGINMIKAYHFARNVACSRVLEKLGFVFMAYEKSAVLKRDQWEDIVIYKKDCIR